MTAPILHVIRVNEEHEVVKGQWSVHVLLDGQRVSQQSITLNDPQTPFQAHEEEWYHGERSLEEQRNGIREAQCLLHMESYGQQLFKQLFGQRDDAMEAFRKCDAWGFHKLRIEIHGGPAFQSLKWEELQDNNQGRLA